MLQSNLWFCLFRCFCVFVLLVSFPFWSMPHDLPDQAQRRQKLPSSLMYTSFIKPVMQVCHQDNLYKSFLCIHAKLVHVSSFRERWHYQIGWISGKIPNGLWPPPSFSENYIAIFYSGYGCIYARRYEGQIVWNACTCLLQSVSCFDFSQYNCWKTYPEPWIYSLCINFMLKKPCSKFPNLRH